MSKRKQWEVRLVIVRRRRRWHAYKGKKKMYDYSRKTMAVSMAALYCNTVFRCHGELSELTIKRADGTIQDKRTYGRDPRRTKG